MLRLPECADNGPFVGTSTLRGHGGGGFGAKRQEFVTPVKQIHDMAKKTAICHTSEANS